MPRLLFISFIDFGDMKSGSSVRPQRMYDAFKKLGYDVDLLSGLQNRKRERWHRVWEKYHEIRQNPPDFCYVEPPSGPFFNLCDHLLLLWLKHRGVPIGLFYRDAYWLFADFWPVHGLKRFFLRKMHQFDLFIIRRTCKVVFFPTQSMSVLFKLPRMRLLPPAGVDMVIPSHPLCNRALYVGGVSSFYGTDIMLKAFSIVNDKLHRKIALTVVCREREMGDFFKKYEGRPWLTIKHLSGDRELAPVYKECDIALYPSRKDFYMDFCMPVKLFEYLSRGLPVATTNCKETAAFVESNGIGVVAQSDAQSFADSVLKLYDNPTLMQTCRENAVKTLRERSLWVHRAQNAAEEILS